MVLFTKNALTQAALLGHRLNTAAQTRGFAYLVKSLPKPGQFRKVPHPEHVKSINLWRNIFILAGIPAIILNNISIIFFEDHHPKRPDFAPYEYMRKRSKRFAWGDGNHTLFHNEYYNALPDGYETPDDWVEKQHGGHH